MLGHVVARYLKETDHKISTIDERYDYFQSSVFLDIVSKTYPDAIINCIGLIKQKININGTNIHNIYKLLSINSIFPLQLSIKFPKTIIIHPSTDCVFSGKKGNYLIDDLPDTNDIYGVSKSLGEIISRYPFTYVIRTSIIGPELGNNKGNNKGFGLLEWFLSQDNAVDGYTNHKWNGVTTLEWSKCALEILSMVQIKDAPQSKIIQMGTSKVHSKSEILHMISDIWKHDIKIIDTQTEISIDRSLKPTWIRKPLLEQLKELHKWYYANN
jgi:dTDP-4-dehydrorhamnose reductase